MAPRKKTSTRKKKSMNKNNINIVAPLFFVGLIIVAGAGWYVSIANKPVFHDKVPANNIASINNLPVPTKPASTIDTTPQTVQPLPKTSQIIVPQQESKQVPIPVITPSQLSKHPEPIITQQMPIPQSKDLAFANPTAPSASTLNSGIKDPRGPQDSAKIVFARKRTIIYEKANTGAKRIAVVEQGQEMRSYTKQGNWHKVTVPRAGIIGWAQDSSFIP